MARTAAKNLGTDIAIGITGTTGNVDPNNAGSVQGQVFFCILINGKAYSYEWNVPVAGMSRHEIKQMYADRVCRAGSASRTVGLLRGGREKQGT